MPVVLLDNRFDALNQDLAYNFGADVYLSKPFEPSELIKVVRRLLRSKQEAYNAGPVFGGMSDPGRQLPTQEIYDLEESDIEQSAGRILTARQSPEAQAIPTGLPEAALPHPRNRRYFMLCSVVAVIILVALALAILRRTHTSSTPTIQRESSSNGTAQDSAVASGERRAELTPRRELAFEGAGTISASGEKNTLNAFRQSVSAKATQTAPPGSSKEQPAISHAGTTRAAPRQDSPTGSARKDLPAANNAPAYAPVTRPRSVTSSRSMTISGHLKRSGQEMKEAGGHFISGVKHFGKGGGKSASWAGKKVGRGVGRVGGALKKIF